MELVAYGAQDVYLTGNPQITYYKIVYKRHTHFAVETYEQVLSCEQGDIDFGKSIQDQPTIKGKYSRFPWLKKLPPELRRTGRDVLGAIKNRIPYGKIFKGVIFPPVFS